MRIWRRLHAYVGAQFGFPNLAYSLVLGDIKNSLFTKSLSKNRDLADLFLVHVDNLK